MSTVVDARLSAGEFALGRTVRRHPDVRFEFGRAVATGADDPVPFLWATGGDLDAVGASLAADPTTATVDVLGRFDDARLFEVEWAPRGHLLFDVFLGREGSTLLSATATAGEWRLRLAYPGTECARAVAEECDELGLDLDVDRAHPLSAAFTREQFQLTETQHETILAAYEAGYYDVPRKSNLKQLAEELDISHQALSERLRRGHEALMENSPGVEFDGTSAAGGGIEAPSVIHPDGE